MKYSGLLLFFSFALIGCQSNKESSDKNLESPNVVLIVIDDLGYADLSVTGLTDDIQTPNIDAIAHAGTRFSNAYATSSICSPSRAGLITGSQQQRWGTYWYGGPGIHDSVYKTIPELLKQKNYATGYVGKVHYGSNDYKIDNRSFPLNHGFDYFYGHTSARKHYFNHKDTIESSFFKIKVEHKKQGQSLRQQALWENNDKVDTIGFSTQLFGLKARKFIKDNKDSPFFLQLSFNAVHNFTHQLPKDYLEKKGLNGYHDWNPSKEDYYEWYQKGRYPNNPEGRAQYLGQLHYLDKEIGSVTKSLKDNGLLENTIIVLISDNGGSTPIYANNYPLRGSKYTLYEGGIRVPLIISYPSKYKKGNLSDNVVSAMDVLPTLCSQIGINIPNKVDGIDLTKLLNGEDKTLQHEILAWNNKAQTALRKGKWKLRTASEKAKANSDYEMVEMEYGDFLYDIINDPGETTNLANKFPDTLMTLKALFKSWRTTIEK